MMNESSPIDFALLPKGSSIDNQGRATLHGLGLSQIAKEFGTPIFVYDAEHIQTQARAAMNASNWEVVYASKAFLCLELVRIFDGMGIGLDVASGGELYLALKGGFDPQRVIFHGNNKSPEELKYALSSGVGLIVVDSMSEIFRLEAIARDMGLIQNVLVRVTPGVEAHTHEYIMTGQEDSKFGFSVKSGKAHEGINAVLASPHLRFEGIHAHVGSQIFFLDSYEKEVDALAGLIKEFTPRVINLGGGLGVAYVNGEITPTFEEWALAVEKSLSALEISSDTRIMVEPGRSLIASSAMTIYRVGTIKELVGLRTYVSVDGGMSDNPRPVLYGSGYEAFAVDTPMAERDCVVTIVGKHCESGDVLIRDARLPSSLVENDLIATPVTGAYGYSMASNYNRVPRPPVVFVDRQGARLAIRGETYEDLTRLEI